VKVKNVTVQVGEEPWLLFGDPSDVSVAVCHKMHINSEEKSQDEQKVLNILRLRPYADLGGRAV
jgi:hypothetical protein